MSTAPGSPVYALADPTEVDIAAIERELESIWRDAAKSEGTESVTRATAFNLVYVTSADDDAAANLLAKLTLDHPSRSILLLLGQPDEPAAQTAWVAAYCHRPNPNAPQICSEFISLECKGPAITHAASTLRSLMLGGLPTVIVWSSLVDIHHPLLTEFGYDSDRVITDVVQSSERVSAINRLWNIRRLFGAHVVVSDIIWSALLPTRMAIARAFDVRDATHVRHISFDTWSVDTAIIGAWLASSLNWTFVGTEKTSGATHFSFAGERTISFIDSSATAGGSTLTLRSEIAEAVTVDFIRAERTLVDLIGGELRIWSRDPIFDRTFDMLQEWLARR
jgi:glucose-6-phosphate dehydrogenase assembly protein OpcA